MGDWLQGNIARTQSAIQANEAASQAKKRAADTITASNQNLLRAFQPMAQAQADVFKQEQLYGEGEDGGDPGTLRKFQMDLMGQEHEYNKEFAEIQEGHVTSREYNTYKKTTGNDPWVKRKDGTQYLSNDFIKWKYGNDIYLQWERFNSQKRLEEGGLDRYINDAVINFRNEHADMLETDPVTGEPIGYDSNKRKQLVNHLGQRIWKSGRAREWGIRSLEQANKAAEDLIKDYDWANNKVSAAAVNWANMEPNEQAKFFARYNVTPQEFGVTDASGRSFVSKQDRKKIYDFNTLINNIYEKAVKEDKLYDVYQVAKEVKDEFGRKWHKKIYEGRLIDNAMEEIRQLFLTEAEKEAEKRSEEGMPLDEVFGEGNWQVNIPATGGKNTLEELSKRTYKLGF